MFSHLLKLALVVLTFVFCSIVCDAAQITRPTDKQIHDLRIAAVNRINADRRREKLPPVEFDELSSKVADAHCGDVVDRGVISHWSSDGRKPYMRYSWAGGRDGVAENLAYSFGSIETDLASLPREINLLEDGFMAEVPPKDGHRQNILTRHHTHVGIGFAWTQTGLCYAQEFIDRYVKLDDLSTTASLQDKMLIRGSVINPAYRLHSIEIVYEPFPKKMSKDELARTYAYELPQDDNLVLRPKAPNGQVYADGSDGEITESDNSFEVPMKFYKRKPGVYTVVVWLVSMNDQVQAAMVSIRVNN